MAQVERILIVGGGIAGLTLATALHQQGFRAELVERNTAWHAVGAGIMVHANGLLYRRGPIEWVELDRWHSSCVVLIGDAAHASVPLMGEGGCMAMEGAYVLAEVLREAETVESTLDTYVARRRPRAAWVQQESRAVAQSFLLPPAVRNAALRERGDQMIQDRFGPLRSAV